jgi:hypothetical protein
MGILSGTEESELDVETEESDSESEPSESEDSDEGSESELSEPELLELLSYFRFFVDIGSAVRINMSVHV